MSATFLDVIWPNRPGLYGEIRAIHPTLLVGDPPRHDVRQAFIPLNGARGTDGEMMARHYQDGGYDVYYGVLPRATRGGTAAHVPDLTDILWADIDAKVFSTDLQEGKALAHKALGNVLVPQILVDSGGGLHAYWLLDRSIDFTYAHSLMFAIAKRVGGDAVYDRARVLRVPGTVNQKRQPLVEARILRFDLSRTYKPGDFDDLVVVERPRVKASGDFVRNDELPAWLLDLIKDGVPQGQRSEACFKVAIWLIRYGRTDKEIELIFESTPDGIGAKYAEKRGAGPRWLARTIAAARREA